MLFLGHQSCRGHAGSGVLDKRRIVDTVVIFLAEYFYLVVLALAIAILVLRYRRRLLELAAAAAIIGGLAFALAQVGTRLIADPRPFLVSGVPPLIPSAQDNGFPSDHTLLVATAAAVVTVANPRAGVLFWAAAALVGLARVYAGVHHLLDVAGSLVIVGLALAAFMGIRRVWLARNAARQTPLAN
jgi:undecaprenyl-diphosphatase